MGAGALTATKITELQSMQEQNALGMLNDAGVNMSDAKTVMARVKQLDTSTLVVGETIALLVEGLSPNAQDALVAMAMRSPRSSPFLRKERRPPRGHHTLDGGQGSQHSDGRQGSQHSLGAVHPHHGGLSPSRLRPNSGDTNAEPRHFSAHAGSRGGSRASSAGSIVGSEIDDGVAEEICNYETLTASNPSGHHASSLSGQPPVRTTSFSGPHCESLVFPDSLLAPPDHSLLDYERLDKLDGAAPWSPQRQRDEESGELRASTLSELSLNWSPPLPCTVGAEARVLKDRWKLGKLIGSGSYGQVFKGLNLDTGALIAVKTLILPSCSVKEESTVARELEQIHREIDLMSSLSHANIVSYLGAEVDHEACKLHIFQEWVPGGSLSQVLKQFGGTFDDAVTRRYLVHLLRGLIYLHEHRIVHRDIKGENVLISDAGVAKLADMGASKRVSADGTLNDTNSLKGTPYFMAPEQMRQKRVGRKADVWALGGVALLMASGDPPWKALRAHSPYALMVAVIQADAGPPIGSYDLHPDLRDFIEACFTRDADKRPSSEELATHRFLLSSAHAAGIRDSGDVAPGPRLEQQQRPNAARPAPRNVSAQRVQRPPQQDRPGAAVTKPRRDAKDNQDFREDGS